MAERPGVEPWRDAVAASGPAAVAAAFARFGALECRGYCPFYERLSARIAADPDVVALTLDRLSGQPAPNLLFGAVRWLLLRGTDHSLRSHYERVSRDAASASGDVAWPDFRSFCLDRRDAIVEIVRTRRVQTNEVARAAGIRFGVAAALAEFPAIPVTLIEIGCSAGLLLSFDRLAYAYRTGDGQTLATGPADAPVTLECEVRGAVPTALRSPVPNVVSRIGIDLHPIDVRDRDAILWLKALVWPDRPDRERHLEAAARGLIPLGVDLRAGNASDLLPTALQGAPDGSVICVFHSSFWHQVSTPDRERIDSAILDASRRQPVARVSCESLDGHANQLRVGLAQERLIARVHPHGAWIEPATG